MARESNKKGFDSDQTSKPFHTIKLNPITAGKPLLKGF
ncbi:hypothetical protein JavanS260_0015 [Streptococcus satellite phage Javan260]|nr:hypothetical protein JavanS260_0015 [Streptococcus satellite phage Javan260]